MTKVLKCKCQHEFQDSVYGKGYRVFNECMSGAKVTGYRCTVCGNTVK